MCASCPQRTTEGERQVKEVAQGVENLLDVTAANRSIRAGVELGISATLQHDNQVAPRDPRLSVPLADALLAFCLSRSYWA
jgi:hypothetical protein